MLREILDVLQDDPSSVRRWFHDNYFDLYTRAKGAELVAFELCYGIHAYERALVWKQSRGFFHDGEPSGEFIGSGLKPGDSLDADPIIARFKAATGRLPESLRSALEARLREFALENAEGSARRARFRRADWQRTGDILNRDR